MYKNVFIVIFSLLFANQVFAKNNGILVSIKPLHSLVSAVVGKTDKVSLLIKGSMSPHSFALKPSDTKLLNNSAVFFYIDDQLESALKKTVGGLPDDVNVIKVSTFKNLNLLPVREDVNWEEDGHDHHGHGHDHGSNDIHFWLDPDNAIKIIKGITQKLSSIYPENISAYKTNAKQIIQKIVTLDSSLKANLESIKNKPYIVFHDAYQYFEKAYNLNAIGSILLDPELPPSPQRIIKIRTKIENLKAHCVFKEPQFKAKIINTVIEGSEIKVGILDPLGANIEPGPEMYLNLLNDLSKNLTGCLSL